MAAEICLRRLCLVAVSLVALFTTAHGNFVSSLHSNFVVKLDFEGDQQDSSETSEGQESVDMSFAGGRQKFRCNLPSTASNRRNGSSGGSEDVTKYRSHFMNAKLAPYRGKCWNTRKDYWQYSLCFGAKITQFRQGEEGRTFSLGEYVADSAVLHADGHVTEFYSGGTDNRSSEIQYVCGIGTEEQKTVIEEPQTLRYVITVFGPGFCSWREKDGAGTTDASGNIFPISMMLEPLRGNCVNITQGWWTYEYCYPVSLRQFHLGNQGQRDPEHVLGQLNSSEPDGVGKVDMRMVRLKPSINNRDRRAPPSNHQTLRQFLGGGTVCDETNRPRTTTMHFQCPPNWQSLKQQEETRIININEGSLCEYDIMVQTNLLCGHQRLIPALPKGREEIKCVAVTK